MDEAEDERPEEAERPKEDGRPKDGAGAAGQPGGFSQQQRLVEVVLDEASILRRAPDVEHERAVAIYDLIENNCFALPGRQDGPYRLRLGLQENRRLVLDIRNDANDPLAEVLLPLTPLRRVIKDYFTVCESYFDAIRTATPSRIEAIDMGRRGLHNEGSEILLSALSGRIEIDFQTARRLFTLVCVLHVRGQGR